jgi:hypothetical protein
MKIVIRENIWIPREHGVDFGWGNGYVLIPEDHPLHGKHYDDIDVDVHGGLTWSKLVDEQLLTVFRLDKEDLGTWCVGFDTAHLNDNLSTWPKEAVQKETERLKDQLMSYQY